MTRTRRARPASAAALAWVCAWLPLLVLGVAASIADRRASDLLHWSLAAALTPLVFRGFAPTLRRALPILAVLVSSALVGETFVARWTWHPVAGLPGSVATQRWLGTVGAQTMEAGPAGGSVERVWTLPEAVDGPLVLSFDVRQTAGPAGWSWYAYDPGFAVRPVPGADGFAEVTTPPDRGSYVTRRIDTGAPLAGRTFRASLRLRASEPLDYAASACRGVLLREVGGSGAASCFAQQLTTAWQDLTFTWRVPDTATSPIIRIELRVEAASFEVGDVRLEEASDAGWAPLGPLEPAGMVVTVAVPGAPPIDWPRRVVVPTTDPWTSWAWRLEEPAVGAGDAVRVLLRLEPATAIQVRGAELRTGSRATLPPRTVPPRAEGWWGHPNLAGHALASLGAAASATAPSAAAAAVLGAVTLVGTQTTGSRTAFVTALVVLFGLVWFTRRRDAGRRRSTPWAVAAFMVIATVAATLGGLSDRVANGPLDDGNTISRMAIWEHAWEIVRERPWSGLPAMRTFRDSWGTPAANASEATPTHAHNLWLDLGASHGWPGLAAGVAWAIGVLVVSLRYLPPVATIVTLGFLLLQTTDVTAPNTSVYLPYVAFMTILLGRRMRTEAAGEARRMSA